MSELAYLATNPDALTALTALETASVLLTTAEINTFGLSAYFLVPSGAGTIDSGDQIVVRATRLKRGACVMIESNVAIQTSSSVVKLVSTEALPLAHRPWATVSCPLIVWNSGAWQATDGTFTITTAGIMEFVADKTNAATVWDNATANGFKEISLSYITAA